MNDPLSVTNYTALLAACQHIFSFFKKDVDILPTSWYYVSVDKMPTDFEERGDCRMTNTELLREKIDQSGYKLRFIAKKIGITYQGLLNKINNRSEFRANEIQALYDLLGLTEEERVAIFFAC